MVASRPLTQAGAMTTTPGTPGNPGSPGDPGPQGPDAAAPPPGGATAVDDGPRVTRDEVRDLGRLRRTTGVQRNIAGVAGGLGRHLDIDPVILRVAFVVLAFFGGAGILLYVACWLLVPDDTSVRAPFGLDERSRTVGLVIAGGVAALSLLGSSLGDGFVPFPVVVVAGIALFVVLQLNKRRGTPPVAPHGPPPYDPVAASAWSPAPAGTVTLDKPVAPPPWTPAPVRVNPRKRGPILFWFTLALCALGIGLLGVLDLAGAPVAGPAYPALVVGVCGAMLVLGAFWGRAGGLVAVGLLATVVLVGSIAAQEIDTDTLRASPTTAAEVRSAYDLDTGDLVVDLRGVTDLAALDGRTITLTNHVGRIEVLVPDGLLVTARATVDGPGHLEVFDAERGGIDQDLARSNADAPVGAPDLTIIARIDVGEIQVHERTSR